MPYQARNPLIPGTVVTLAGEEFTIPPLTLGQWKRLAKARDTLRGTKGELSDDGIDAQLEIIQTAMARNYPGITAAELLDMVDLGNLKEISEAIIALNKLVPAGEAKAAANGAAPAADAKPTELEEINQRLAKPMSPTGTTFIAG